MVTQIIPPILWLAFSFCYVSLDVRTLFNLMSHNLLIVAFVHVFFGVISTTLLPGISVWSFFIISVSLVTVSFGSQVLLLILLNHVSVLSCRLLTFFETATFDFY